MRRKDSKRTVLKIGESERSDGRYVYRWTDKFGKRHSVYARNLTDLRRKEKAVEQEERLLESNVVVKATINEIFDRWLKNKRDVKEITLIEYSTLYNSHIRKGFGNAKAVDIRKSDVREFLNNVADDGYGYEVINKLKYLLSQAFNVLIESEIITVNPSTIPLKGIVKMKPKKRKALTRDEQGRFMDFVKNSSRFSPYYSIFAFLLGTGMRVGEAICLMWSDIDMAKREIHVTKTRAYIPDKMGKSRGINTEPKTVHSNRIVPMSDFVYELLLSMPKDTSGILFPSSKGNIRKTNNLNNILRKIVEAHNDNNDKPLPKVSCHWFRHTFATRMYEAGANIKVIQKVLGHSSSTTTISIYTEGTDEYVKETMQNIRCFG